jgi:hypothetical protein
LRRHRRCYRHGVGNLLVDASREAADAAPITAISANYPFQFDNCGPQTSPSMRVRSGETDLRPCEDKFASLSHAHLSVTKIGGMTPGLLTMLASNLDPEKQHPKVQNKFFLHSCPKSFGNLVS